MEEDPSSTTTVTSGSSVGSSGKKRKLDVSTNDDNKDEDGEQETTTTTAVAASSPERTPGAQQEGGTPTRVSASPDKSVVYDSKGANGDDENDPSSPPERKKSRKEGDKDKERKTILADEDMDDNEDDTTFDHLDEVDPPVFVGQKQQQAATPAIPPEGRPKVPGNDFSNLDKIPPGTAGGISSNAGPPSLATTTTLSKPQTAGQPKKKSSSVNATTAAATTKMVTKRPTQQQVVNLRMPSKHTPGKLNETARLRPPPPGTPASNSGAATRVSTQQQHHYRQQLQPRRGPSMKLVFGSNTPPSAAAAAAAAAAQRRTPPPPPPAQPAGPQLTGQHAILTTPHGGFVVEQPQQQQQQNQLSYGLMYESAASVAQADNQFSTVPTGELGQGPGQAMHEGGHFGRVLPGTIPPEGDGDDYEGNNDEGENRIGGGDMVVAGVPSSTKRNFFAAALTDRRIWVFIVLFAQVYWRSFFFRNVVTSLMDASKPAVGVYKTLLGEVETAADHLVEDARHILHLDDGQDDRGVGDGDAEGSRSTVVSSAVDMQKPTVVESYITPLTSDEEEENVEDDDEEEEWADDDEVYKDDDTFIEDDDELLTPESQVTTEEGKSLGPSEEDIALANAVLEKMKELEVKKQLLERHREMWDTGLLAFQRENSNLEEAAKRRKRSESLSLGQRERLKGSLAEVLRREHVDGASEGLATIRRFLGPEGEFLIDGSKLQLWDVPMRECDAVVGLDAFLVAMKEWQNDMENSARNIIADPKRADAIVSWIQSAGREKARTVVLPDTLRERKSKAAIKRVKPKPKRKRRFGIRSTGSPRDEFTMEIQNRLEIDRADQTGLVDYASILNGAEVIRSGRRRTTMSLVGNLPLLNRLAAAMSLRFYGYGPEAALTPTFPRTALGQCWAFDKSTTRMASPPPGTTLGTRTMHSPYATLTVRLAQSVYVDQISIEHPSRDITDRPTTAIRAFNVHGYESDDASGRSWDLGRFEYRWGKGMRQEFNIPGEIGNEEVPELRSISLDIDSTWGTDLACLYRFRVHGSN